MSAGDQILKIELTKHSSRFAKINGGFSDGIKRLFDIIISFFVLFLFSPFFVLIAIAIKRSSPGPVFYKGSRIGRYGKPFRIVKFRTMEETPKSYAGPRITAHDDSRITSIGRWLRDTKLNEFPQFWNVLKGDMSLVGPRPEDPKLAKTWPKGVWKEVLSVRPGITSPASVQYRDEEKLLSNCNVEQMYLLELSPNKVRLDQLYVRYRSFLLDLDTIFWTTLRLLPSVGSYEPPEELLFVGLFSRFTRRFLNWFTIDLLITFMAFGITGFIFRLHNPLDVGVLNSILLAFAYAILFGGMGVLFGTNRIRWSKANPSDYFDLVPSWVLATTVGFFSNMFFGFFPSEFILIASLLSLFGYFLGRARTLIITHFLDRSLLFHDKSQMIRERVLIIGLGASAQHTAWLFEHLMNSRTFSVVGFVDNDLMKQGMRYYGEKVLGQWEDIPTLVKKFDVGLIILADYRVDSKELHLIKEICSPTDARLVIMPDILASINHLAKRASSNYDETGVLGGTVDSKCIDCLAQRTFSSR